MSNNSLKVINKSRMLSEAERKMYDIMYSEKAVDTKTSTYVDLLTTAYATIGQKAKGEDMAILAKQLKAEIQQYFKSLTFAELSIAINNALRGEYGEIYGLNIVTFHKAIKGYLNAEKTLKDKKAVLARLAAPEEVQKTEEEKEAILQGSYNRLKLAVEKGNSIAEDYGALGCYNWLVKNKRLTASMFTEKELTDIRIQAIEILKSEFHSKTQTLHRETRSEFNLKLQKLADGLLENDVVSLCKRLCLELAFKTNRV